MRGDSGAIVIPHDSDVLVGLSTWGISLSEDYCANLPGEVSHSVPNLGYLRYSNFLGVWHVSSRLSPVVALNPSLVARVSDFPGICIINEETKLGVSFKNKPFRCGLPYP